MLRVSSRKGNVKEKETQVNTKQWINAEITNTKKTQLQRKKEKTAQKKQKADAIKRTMC